MNSAKNVGEKLPDGWVLCQSKSIPGRKYYFNKKTGKSLWSQPQEDEKFGKKVCKKEKLKKQEKRKREEQAKQGAKRKSDSQEEMAFKKRRHDISEACSSSSSSKKGFTTYNEQRRNGSPRYTSTPKTTPSKSAGSKNEALVKKAPVKNLANTRLTRLRTQLSSDIQDEDSDTSQKKIIISPKSNEAQKKSERKSPSLNDSRSTQSPNSDSFQSMPSPSQFLAANKIISSMKAQLPEEYCCKEKQKDTFADIEKGICSKTTEYPFSKHPTTPPQFSEASKLVSAIKSKLAYKVSSSKDVKIYSSAKERMENFRASLSSEGEQGLNCSSSFLNTSVEDSKNMSEAMEIEDVKEVKPKSPPIQRDNLVDNCEGNNLVLVVDTNIFILELDFIMNVLNSHIKGYNELPTLLVPWRVINELDRLKDNNNGEGALCKRAKAAMDYLYKSLPENSRIKGQSLRDANSHIYPCEVPDDEILNCSLQQVERGKNVILLSNDKNLGNKATINGVKRINVQELNELLENKPQPSNPDLLESVKHYQQTLHNLLANILENEMRAKYNNLWKHVLFKVPPWTLVDILLCLLKHWVAVFSEVFPRIEMLLTDLKNSLVAIEKKNPNTLTRSEVDYFKDLCLDVAKKCRIIPEYMELAKLTVASLLKYEGEKQEERREEIQGDRREEIHGERREEIQGEMHGESRLEMQGERRLEMQGKRRLEMQGEGRPEMQGERGLEMQGERGWETQGERRGVMQEKAADSDNKEVVEAFEEIWTVLSSYGAKLSTALGIEHSIIDKLPGVETLPELSGKLEQFTSCVHDLISAINGVLEAGPTLEAVQRLQRALATPAQAHGPGAARLAAFCAHCRNMLQEAHSKLSQLAQLLNVCRSRFSMNF